MIQIDRSADTAFAHPALFYQGPWEYLSATIPFVREGLAADDPVAVAVPGPRLQLLRDELGALAQRVQLVDMSVVGRNPGRVIVEVVRAAVDAHPDRHVRVIGEPVRPDRSDLQYPTCVEHEALINTAFAGCAATILCPYDLVGLDPAVVADALTTHPTLVQAGQSWPSPGYAPTQTTAADTRPPPGPADATVVAFDAVLMRCARHAAAAHAERTGLDADRVDDVLLAVDEMAAHGVGHGGGSGVLRTWTEAGYLVCEVQHAPAGGRPGARHELGGRGLVLVHHVADLVRMHTGPEGTAVRCYFRLAGARPADG